MTAALVRDPETTTINDLSGTIDALTGSIDDLSGVGKDTFFMGGEGSSAYVYRPGGESADGAVITSWALGRWHNSGDGRYIRIRALEVDAKWTDLWVGLGTTDRIDGSVGIDGFGYPNDGKVDINRSARYVAPYFSSNATTSSWEVTGYRLNAFPVGRR